MRNGNSIIQGLWIGGDLSPLERISLRSFLTNGHEFVLYAYDTLTGVPSGVVVEDAEKIIPRSRLFRYVTGSYAVFADLFRYKLLLEKGGWWSDLDVVCLRPFDFPNEYVFATEPDERGRAFVTNSVIKAPVGSPVLKSALAFCETSDLTKLRWGASGPDLLHRLVSCSEFSQFAQPPETFCPMSPQRWITPLLPSSLNALSTGCYAVHLWNEMWRRFSVNKYERFAPQSLFEQFRAMYLPDLA